MIRISSSTLLSSSLAMLVVHTVACSDPAAPIERHSLQPDSGAYNWLNIGIGAPIEAYREFQWDTVTLTVDGIAETWSAAVRRMSWIDSASGLSLEATRPYFWVGELEDPVRTFISVFPSRVGDSKRGGSLVEYSGLRDGSSLFSVTRLDSLRWFAQRTCVSELDTLPCTIREGVAGITLAAEWSLTMPDGDSRVVELAETSIVVPIAHIELEDAPDSLFLR